MTYEAWNPHQQPLQPGWVSPEQLREEQNRWNAILAGLLFLAFLLAALAWFSEDLRWKLFPDTRLHSECTLETEGFSPDQREQAIIHINRSELWQTYLNHRKVARGRHPSVAVELELLHAATNMGGDYDFGHARIKLLVRDLQTEEVVYETSFTKPYPAWMNAEAGTKRKELEAQAAEKAEAAAFEDLGPWLEIVALHAMAGEEERGSKLRTALNEALEHDDERIANAARKALKTRGD